MFFCFFNVSVIISHSEQLFLLSWFHLKPSVKFKYRLTRSKFVPNERKVKYNLHFENGVYNCNGCKTPLFNSDQKFETNCGWPSFDEAIEGTIKYVEDYSHNMIRTEIVCVKCDGHLGHVFNDGPTETGLRYCVNSVSIDFKKDPNKK